MISLRIQIDCREVDLDKFRHLDVDIGEVHSLEILVIDKGMSSGQPSIIVHFTAHDGAHFIANTSARLFCEAASEIIARYPDLLAKH